MTVESVFKSRTLGDIYDEIRKVYLSDNRPWILGFSGGKIQGHTITCNLLFVILSIFCIAISVNFYV